MVFMEIKMSNPLVAAYRKPALYISLPSKGKFYQQKPKLSVDDELAVYAMTARDELVSKTPDALFNGEATISLIKSCCPDIIDPNEVPVNDLLTILIAIRQASYGQEIDLDVKCPQCEFMNQLQIDGSRLLSGTMKDAPENVKLDSGFKVFCKPYSLRDRTLLQVQTIKQQKLIESLADAQLSDEEREAQFGRTFVEIADLTVGLIANCITKVQTPDNEIFEADKIDLILEWLQSITKADYDLIKETVENLSENNIDTKFTATCQGCSHEWQTTVDLDIANFFEG